MTPLCKQLFRSRAALMAGVLAFAPFQDEAGDVVFLRNGTQEAGRVSGESLAGVEFQGAKGPKRTLPWAEVQSVEYGDAPEELASAQAAFAAGNLELALEQLGTVLGTEDLRPGIKQQALFLSAHLQQRLGSAPQAIETYSELLKEFPQGRYALRAGESLIALHVRANDAAAAEAALGGIKDGLKDFTGGEPVAGLLEAGMLASTGKTAAAREKYAEIEKLAGIDAALAEEARLGRAQMLQIEGQAGEAEPILRNLVETSTSARVQSGAWNGLGDIQSTAGRAKKDSNLILDALFAYLRTVVQYKPLPGEGTAQYERALAGAAKCFEYLSQLEQAADRKKLLNARKQERLDQLQREFPHSPFLKQN